MKQKKQDLKILGYRYQPMNGRCIGIGLKKAISVDLWKTHYTQQKKKHGTNL